MINGIDDDERKPYATAVFYQRRADQSRKMEIAAQTPMIALIHRNLAYLYDGLAEDARTHEVRNGTP